MSKVRIHMMTTLDGYVAGPNQRADAPFGDGAEQLTAWVFKLRSFRQMLGLEGGDTGPSDDVMRETMEGLGATVMGRNMFGGGPGPWSKEPWNGWWGDNPPFHTPVFVLTHYPREPLVMQGGTTFTFVTDGFESALTQARAAAGDKDIRIGGGGNVANQALAAGVVDELELHIVPMLLGGGSRLFEGLATQKPRLERIRTVEGANVTHVKYRVLK